jgi:hypothetical protein
MSRKYSNLKDTNTRDVNRTDKKIFNSVSKKHDIMDDVEIGIELGDDIPLMTPQLILVKSIRENIQSEVERLDRRAYILNVLDWFLFSVAVICMGLTGMGIDYRINSVISLVQLFGVIALACKLTEKGLSMTKAAKNTYVAASAMKELLREIATIEIQFYSPGVDQIALLAQVKKEIEEIWSEFDQLGLETFIQPDIGDQVAQQRNMNISINLQENGNVTSPNSISPNTSTTSNTNIVTPNTNIIPQSDAEHLNIRVDSNDNVTIKN